MIITKIRRRMRFTTLGSIELQWDLPAASKVRTDYSFNTRNPTNKSVGESQKTNFPILPPHLKQS